MSEEKQFDIVVFGATGYTGRLVCEYLNNTYGVNGDVKWAMAGRNLGKIESVRDAMEVSVDVPMLVANNNDLQSLKKMVAKTKVVLTTVGPYQLYGKDLLKECIAAGIDYVDLCGEPNWMHDMIAENEAAAKVSGARIVFSCGFDCIPSDLGVYFLQQIAKEKLGAPFNRIKCRVRALQGKPSGGTLASLNETLAVAAKNPDVLALMANPFALTNGFKGPEQPSGMKPIFEEDLNSWSAPFFMAPINTKHIHRSNYLLDYQYGSDFVYDEMFLTGPGEEGESIAQAVAADDSMIKSELKPGEGPTKEERDNGYYDLLFIGSNDKGESIMASVKGDRDPGYGSTCKLISESAICLLKNPDLASGGIWTAASAMGNILLERLHKNAGLSFVIEDQYL